MFEFSVITPQALLAHGQAKAVSIPAAQGDLVAMAGHAALICALRPGIVEVDAENPAESAKYIITSGFVDIDGEKISILADWAKTLEQITSEELASIIADAEKSVETAAPAQVDIAKKYLADLAFLSKAVQA